jgi:hypothetical protein
MIVLQGTTKPVKKCGRWVNIYNTPSVPLYVLIVLTYNTPSVPLYV